MEKESEAGGRRKKPHFFKVFLPGLTSELLEVPPGFRKHMEGDFSTCSLMGPSGNIWSVELLKDQAGGLFFEQGWNEFARDHALETGEFVVFVYDGASRFRVLILDISACEKEAAFRAFPSRSTITVEKAKKEQQETTEQIPDAAPDASIGLTVKTGNKSSRKEEGGEEDPHAAGFTLQREAAGASLERRLPRADAPMNAYSRRRRSRGVLVSQRRPVTKDEIDRAHSAAIAFRSDNPSQVLIMRKSAVYLGHSMPLPHSFCRRRLPKTAQTITLSDSAGNSWEVTYLPLDGSYIFSAGWRQFSLDNHLEQDDACVLELIKKNEIRVHIFRVVEEVTPLIRTVIR